ncbi:MAG: metallophosphoesterase [Myxococcota bacterium]|nr:metallophosphoesterase [Myxococcales bacterium]
MPDPLPHLLRWAFPLLAAATWLLVPLYAAVQRGRSFAVFSTVTFGISLAGALAVHLRLPGWVGPAALPWVDLASAAAIAATGVHYAHLVRARLRGELFRRLVSVPGQAFVAASFLATFWLLALLAVRGPLWLLGLGGFDTEPLLAALRPLDVAPYAIGLVALATSARPVHEVVRVRLGDDDPERLTRVPVERHRGRAPAPLAERPLRIVQITDPHLGPWQPVSRLAALVDRLVDRDPDLVLLTGDFLTMESNATPGALERALAPLRRVPDRCYAVFGNHDHEAPDEVRAALAANGVELLVDAATVAGTEAGPVQIVGADFVRRDRDAHLRELLRAHPRLDGHLRLLLLHDPSAFHHLPDDDVDLVLSGHTHGGQVGLVSLGLDWTVLSMFGTRMPDHGLFARGRARLYVHRGTGFYGFPLRVGVPGEASVLELIR